MKQSTQPRRRVRATLAIKSVDFTKLWTSLEQDLTQVLIDPFNATLKNDTEKLHNIVYKLSTGQCFNLPDISILSQNPHSSSIPQDGDIQPHTLYFMLKRLISNHLKLLISKLNNLTGISLLKQYFIFWNNYLIACDFIMKVFHYLNSDWITEQEIKRKSKGNQSEKYTERSLNQLVHFSESNHVCNTKLTCLLLWREWFFERCENLSKLLTDQEADSPLMEEVTFDKFGFYDSIMKIIEMGRDQNNPHSKSSFSVEEFYPILKNVIGSLVYLSLEPEEDFYFSVRYKHYPSMKLFESLNIHLEDYYSKILDKTGTHPIFYLYDFERVFLQTSKRYYSNEIDSLLVTYLSKENQHESVRKYILHVSARLDQETHKNILHYVPQITRDNIQKIMCDLFIEGIKENLSSLNFILSGFEFWIIEPEIHKENLELLYKVIMKSNRKIALNELGTRIRNRILLTLNSDMKKVKIISQDTFDPIQFIDLIIDNYNRYSSIIRQYFSNNYELNICKDKTFKEFFNNAPIFTSDPNTKCAEYLARYINHLLKGSSKPTLNCYSDNLDIESRMDCAVNLCRLLNDVDAFIQYYKVLLAKRLLIFKYEGEATQEEMEYTMITKLKNVCTFGHIYKIQTMLNDLNNAKSLAEQFKKWTENEEAKIPFTAKVLTKGYWPLNSSSLTTPSNTFVVPTLISDRMNSFTEYYTNLYNGRHLTWLNILSRGVVRGHFTNSSMPYYDITVSLVQLSIFLQFNNGDNSKTVQDLSLVVGIPIEELIQALIPIINFKIFNSLDTNLHQNSVITINDNFNYHKNKISLFQHSIKQYYEEGKSNPANQKILTQIKEDRKYTLQAAIIRILKTRKQIEHKQLVNLLLAQLSSNFKPTNSDIKRAIDSLLQQEYLKRVSEDSSWYQYIA